MGLGLVAALLISSRSNYSSRNLSPQFLLVCQALLMAVLSYLQLGIKSSPAVATISLSFAALLAAAQRTSMSAHRTRLKQLVVVCCSMVVFTLSLRYYLPSYYLTNGAGWPNAVEMAVRQCQEADLVSADLMVFQVGDISQSENLSCELLTDWNRWFFRSA